MKKLLLFAISMLTTSIVMAQSGQTEPSISSMTQDEGSVYMSVSYEYSSFQGGTSYVILDKNTGEGIVYENPLKDLVPRLPAASDYMNDAASRITSLYKDGDDLWFGTLFGGLFVQHKDGAIDRVSTMSPIYSLTPMDGSLWIGSGGAVTEFRKGEPVGEGYSLQTGSSFDPVYTIAKDAEDVVWIGTADVLGDHTFCKIVDGEMIRSFPDFWSRVSRLVLRDGILWAATLDNGLYRIDKDGYTPYTAANSELPGNLILDMVKDDADNLWLGMQDNLVKYDGNTFNSYPLNGLVRCMLIDGTTLYVGTDKGLYIFDTEMKSATQAPLVQAPTGISIIDKRENAACSRYSVDGRQLTSPAKGLNIVRMKDGSVRKVMVR